MTSKPAECSVREVTASVLSSPAAVQVGLQVVRAFVRVRQFLATNEDLARKVAVLERRAGVHELELRNLSGAFRRFVEATPAQRPRRRIGFEGEAGDTGQDPGGPAGRVHRARPRGKGTR